MKGAVPLSSSLLHSYFPTYSLAPTASQATLLPKQQPNLSSPSLQGFFSLPLSVSFRKSRSQVPNEFTAALILSCSVEPRTGSKLFNLSLQAQGRSLGNQLWD